jgi:hypothetical protein
VFLYPDPHCGLLTLSIGVSHLEPETDHSIFLFTERAYAAGACGCLAKMLSDIHGTQRFITLFRGAGHWTLS